METGIVFWGAVIFLIKGTEFPKFKQKNIKIHIPMIIMESIFKLNFRSMRSNPFEKAFS
jgi:hypothetical protein